MDKLTIISGCLFLAADIFAIASVVNPDWINTGEEEGKSLLTCFKTTPPLTPTIQLTIPVFFYLQQSISKTCTTDIRARSEPDLALYHVVFSNAVL